MPEYVVLVNEKDEITGTAEKIQAHKEGLLHRAFSIFVFNDENRLLLQKRAAVKYHSAGLWTNTCCSHPQPDESMAIALERRLNEEMGFSCVLTKAFNYYYKIDIGNGLTEHELDHIYIGRWAGDPVVNDNEVEDWRWAGIEEIRKELNDRPDEFTYWFREIFEKVVEKVPLTN